MLVCLSGHFMCVVLCIGMHTYIWPPAHEGLIWSHLSFLITLYVFFYLLISCFVCFLRQGLSLSQNLNGFCMILYYPGPEILTLLLQCQDYRNVSECLTVMWVLIIRVQFLVCVQKALYRLSHLHIPCHLSDTALFPSSVTKEQGKQLFKNNLFLKYTNRNLPPGTGLCLPLCKVLGCIMYHAFSSSSIKSH